MILKAETMNWAWQAALDPFRNCVTQGVASTAAIRRLILKTPLGMGRLYGLFFCL